MALTTEPKSPTQEEFDSRTRELRRALRDWWDDEAQTFDCAVSETSSVWEGMPEIDSKAVVKASPIIRRFTGRDLDPRDIKRGGYSSFDELVDHLFPKLRAKCQPEVAQAQARIHFHREITNVRRS